MVLAGVEKEPAQGCTHERCLGRRADALRVVENVWVAWLMRIVWGEGRQAALGVSLGGERGAAHSCMRDVRLAWCMHAERIVSGLVWCQRVWKRSPLGRIPWTGA